MNRVKNETISLRIIHDTKNVGLFGKYSFEIYFVHFVVFYLMLLGYKKFKLKLFSEHDKNVTNIHEEFSQISDISDPNCLFEDKK